MLFLTDWDVHEWRRRSALTSVKNAGWEKTKNNCMKFSAGDENSWQQKMFVFFLFASFPLDPALFLACFSAFLWKSRPHTAEFMLSLLGLIFSSLFYPRVLCSPCKPFCKKPAVQKHFINKSDLTKKTTQMRSVNEGTVLPPCIHRTLTRLLHIHTFYIQSCSVKPVFFCSTEGGSYSGLQQCFSFLFIGICRFLVCLRKQNAVFRLLSSLSILRRCSNRKNC